MKKAIKVCHVTSVHTRNDTRIFHKECASLARAGYDVTLLVADGKSDEAISGVKIKSVGTVFKSRAKRMLCSRKPMLKKAQETDAEIYHLHDPELLPLGVKLKSLGKKVIFDSHENYPAQIKVKHYLPAIVRNVASAVYRSYETYALGKIDAVIAPCTFYNGVNIFDGRCKVNEIISNAPLLSEFYDRYEMAEKPRSQPPMVCHVGGLEYSRGITHLIKAAYKANVTLALAGRFCPAEYKIEVEKMPEYACVNYLGYLSRAEVLDLYKRSSIGAATILNIGQYNTGDNFATKVYEYMSMGLPVLVSKYPYAEKVLERYKFGVAVDTENIDEIADVIRYIIDNPDMARQMGENGRRAVLEEFNWGIEEKKLLSLYSQLTDASSI